MGAPSVSSVVLVRFPFSDLSSSKLRPAVVLADAGRGDWVLCQITSNPYADPCAVEITDDDFSDGTLLRISYARPGKLFTANESLVERNAGTLSSAKTNSILNGVIALFQPVTE